MSWTYSDNDEIFYGGMTVTREGAIRCLGEDYGSGYIGRIKPLPPFVVDTDWVIDKARDDAYNLAGDASDGWLDEIPKGSEEELEEELSKVFNAWLKKHGLTPSFYEVVDVEAVEAQ